MLKKLVICKAILKDLHYIRIYLLIECNKKALRSYPERERVSKLLEGKGWRCCFRLGGRKYRARCETDISSLRREEECSVKVSRLRRERRNTVSTLPYPHKCEPLA